MNSRLNSKIMNTLFDIDIVVHIYPSLRWFSALAEAGYTKYRDSKENAQEKKKFMWAKGECINKAYKREM
jgi:hypothetical protein